MIRCPLCNKVMPPSYIAQRDGKWQQVYYWVITGSTVIPEFCLGHSKYDPVFYHDSHDEPHYEERTPVPQAFYDAFREEVGPGD